MESYYLTQEPLSLLKQLYLKVYFLSKLTPANFNSYFNNAIENKKFFGKESLLLSDQVPEIALESFIKLSKYLQNIIQLGTANKPVPAREIALARDFIYKYKYPLHIDTINELKQKFLEITNSIDKANENNLNQSTV